MSGEIVGEGGEGRRRSIAKPLKSLGEGSGEGGEGWCPKSLKSFGRMLAKVAKRSTPQTPQRVYARAGAALDAGVGHAEL